MKQVFLISLIVITSNIAVANQLAQSRSPYLALHQNDPVDWREWNQATLAQARREKKPIFVSIGYFACHWCHVMQRESFSDVDIAKQLNGDFVSIKVDRELNPVLDRRLLEFVQATNGRAGWPLNVFLTPDAWPMLGMTYLPAEQFKNAVGQVASKWQSDSKAIQQESRALVEQLLDIQSEGDGGGLKSEVRDNAQGMVRQAMSLADTLQGGFGGQNKFPSITQLQALMQINRQIKDNEVDEFLLLTLEEMQSQGLHDLIGGGFFRYTTDPDWQTPHYEKMLYTNALMVSLYLQASLQYSRKDFLQTGLETLRFLQLNMKGNNGAFVSSLSAIDAQGVEGGYYLVNQQQLNSNLAEHEVQLLVTAWGLGSEEISGAAFLPIQKLNTSELAERLNKPAKDLVKQLATITQKLLAWRQKNRSLPVDDKQLTGLNALVLAAFAQAYDIESASRIDGVLLAKWLRKRWQNETLLDGDIKPEKSTLQDYASTAWALIKWGKVSGDDISVQFAERIALAAVQEFYTDKGWIDSDNSLLPYKRYSQHSLESTLPSAEVMLLETISMSDNLNDNRQIQRIVQSLAGQSSQAMESNPFRFASLINHFY